MRLKEYLDREPTGEAFIAVVNYLNGRDKRKPMPNKAQLKRIIYDAIYMRRGDTTGLGDLTEGFREEADMDDV